MEHQRMLWRLSIASPNPMTDPDRLAVGLKLHLAHAPLTSVLMQIGAQQHAYLAVPGCTGCRTDRCAVGCRSTMLRRLLVDTAPGLVLQPVARGLTTRPYGRAVVAGPGKEGEPFDRTLLAPWPEARLQIGWRMCRSHPTVAALLAVGGDGPDPAQALRDRHWQVWPLPMQLSLHWAATPLPWVLPLGQASALPPTLLLPACNPDDPGNTPVTTQPSFLSERDAPLAAWLHALVADAMVEPQSREEAVPAEPAAPSPWPNGPNNLSPVALGTLIAQMLAEPSFQSTRKGQSGISKGRLVGLKHPALNEPTARALMVWFDRAAVLADPEDGQGPWRAPRPFAITDPERIAAHLRNIPLPTTDDIRAAYGGEA